MQFSLVYSLNKKNNNFDDEVENNYIFSENKVLCYTIQVG